MSNIAKYSLHYYPKSTMASDSIVCGRLFIIETTNYKQQINLSQL